MTAVVFGVWRSSFPQARSTRTKAIPTSAPARSPFSRRLISLTATAARKFAIPSAISGLSPRTSAMWLRERHSNWPIAATLWFSRCKFAARTLFASGGWLRLGFLGIEGARPLDGKPGLRGDYREHVQLIHREHAALREVIHVEQPEHLLLRSQRPAHRGLNSRGNHALAGCEARIGGGVREQQRHAAVHHLADDALRNRQARHAARLAPLAVRSIANHRGLESVRLFAEVVLSHGLGIEQHEITALGAFDLQRQIERPPRDLVHTGKFSKLAKRLHGEERSGIRRFAHRFGDARRQFRRAVGDHFARRRVVEKAQAVFAQQDFVIAAESGLFHHAAVDLHSIGAGAVDDLPAAVDRGVNHGVLARDAGVAEHAVARFRSADGNRPVAGNFEYARVFAGMMNQEPWHRSALPSWRGGMRISRNAPRCLLDR